jgi:class 3 adenylate cyclase
VPVVLQRVTISAKIFSIAVGLVLIMAAVAAVAAHMTNVVSRQLDILATHYMPAYAALSDVDGAAGDQDLWLHRLFAAYDGTAPPDATTTGTIRSEIAEQDQILDTGLAEARRLINEQIANPLGFDDDIALARLDTRLEFLQADRAIYHRLMPLVNDAINGNQHARFLALIQQLDQSRDRFNDRIDAVRADMERLAQDAAEKTRLYQNRTVSISSVLMTIAAALGLAVAALVTAGLVRPVRRLLDGATAIEGGSLDLTLPVTSRDEIGRLTAAFNRMAGELRAKERIRATFGKYIDPRIVQGLIDRPDLNRTDGERRVMTILFCDMKGFTALSEGLTPTALVNVINRYLTLVSAPVREHGGIIDKYIGDAVMAFWGPPFCRAEDQARQACLAAIDQIEAVARLSAELPDLLGVKRGLPQITVRIGIATGEAVVGDIGSDVAKSYTVMGDTVNLASRLEGANKTYGSHILINEQAAEMVGDAVELREIDSILVVGKSEPQRVFEVLGRKGQVSPAGLERRDSFIAGLAAYRHRKWSEAKAAFARCLADGVGDEPAAVFLQRLELLATEPPDESWNGVWSLATK